MLHPGEFALAHTAEYVKIPADLVAFRVEGRSSLGRLAIVVRRLDFIDPGFEGTITLELSNLGRAAVKLYRYADRTARLPHDDQPCRRRPYGSDRGGKYQGQRRRGTQPLKVKTSTTNSRCHEVQSGERLTTCPLQESVIGLLFYSSLFNNRRSVLNKRCRYRSEIQMSQRQPNNPTLVSP